MKTFCFQIVLFLVPRMDSCDMINFMIKYRKPFLEAE